MIRSRERPVAQAEEIGWPAREKAMAREPWESAVWISAGPVYIPGLEATVLTGRRKDAGRGDVEHDDVHQRSLWVCVFVDGTRGACGSEGCATKTRIRKVTILLAAPALMGADDHRRFPFLNLCSPPDD